MIERAEKTLMRYVEQNPAVLRAWLFGSRIIGAPRSDSDLDVALELDKATQPDDWTPLDTWPLEQERFRSELQPLVSEFVLHVIPFYRGVLLPGYLRRAIPAGRLIFERVAGTGPPL